MNKTFATPLEAEVAAAAWMRDVLGFPDAKTTAGGADGGIDVRSRAALAQVKFHRRPTGRPDLNRLVGARGRSACQLLFFSTAGYTKQAIDYAYEMEIALFEMWPWGELHPLSPAARLLTPHSVREELKHEPANELSEKRAGYLTVALAAGGAGAYMLIDNAVDMAGPLGISMLGISLVYFVLAVRSQ